jgi:hypothetical protein
MSGTSAHCPIEWVGGYPETTPIIPRRRFVERRQPDTERRLEQFGARRR